ncbi:MAG: MBL fold metallo-hydrolase [Bacillota bacterium]
MRLVVLGKYSPFPPAGGNCPGYLIEADGQCLLLDCGSGTLAQLQKHVSPKSLRAVVISHFHGDHCSDLAVLKYLADAGKREPTLPEQLTVYAPDQPIDEFRRVAYKDALVAQAVSDGCRVTVGGFELEFFGVVHSLPCLAVRVGHNGKTLCYSGDTRWCDSLLRAGEGVDLLLCEASLLERDREYAVTGHLTAREAGLVARECGARRLVITHVWPFYEEELLKAECEEGFGAPVEVAQQGAAYNLSSA